jgi:hypothetical protein
MASHEGERGEAHGRSAQGFPELLGARDPCLAFGIDLQRHPVRAEFGRTGDGVRRRRKAGSCTLACPACRRRYVGAPNRAWFCVCGEALTSALALPAAPRAALEGERDAVTEADPES